MIETLDRKILVNAFEKMAIYSQFYAICWLSFEILLAFCNEISEFAMRIIFFIQCEPIKPYIFPLCWFLTWYKVQVQHFLLDIFDVR